MTDSSEKKHVVSALADPFNDEVLLHEVQKALDSGQWETFVRPTNKEQEEGWNQVAYSALAALAWLQKGDADRAKALLRESRSRGSGAELTCLLLSAGFRSLATAAEALGHADQAEALFSKSERCISHRQEQCRNPNAADKVRSDERTGERAKKSTVAPQFSAKARSYRYGGLRCPQPMVAGSLSDILAVHETREALQPDRPIVACCHHKAGTHFLMPLVRDMSKAFALPLWFKFYDPEPPHWRICLHQHSRIEDIALPAGYRGVHMVRHPMGLIYSAMLYHERGSEPWLHVPMERFTGATFWAVSSRQSYDIVKDESIETARKVAQINVSPDPLARVQDFDSGYDFQGRTYVEMLKSFDRIEDKLLFEMRTYSRAVILDMLAFSGTSSFFRINLEDVSHDRNMQQVQSTLDYLGFSGPPMARMLKLAARH